MKIYIAVATFLAAVATASPGFVTTTKDAIATAVAPTNFPPLCTFNPDKGEYTCPAVSRRTAESGEVEANVNIDTTTKNDATFVAADCGKCQHDWDECMKKWGCWFYDCNNPCKCQVVKNDPSCKDCSAGQCHA